MLMIRVMRAQKLMSTIIFGRFIKLINFASSAKSISFTFMLSLHESGFGEQGVREHPCVPSNPR
jgi:hypothetical protein